MDNAERFLLVSDVSHAAGVSRDTVLAAVERGELTPVGRSAGGVRIFTPTEVSRWTEARGLRARRRQAAQQTEATSRP
jgi:DNA-binding transcriptional MerR regulator